MLPRIVTALVGLPVLIGIVWVGGYALVALASAAAAIAAWELCRMADSWEQRAFVLPAVALTAALAASGYGVAIADGPLAYNLLVPAGALGAALTLLLLDQRRQSLLATILVTACIVVFVGGALFNASLFAGHSDGGDLVLFVLAVTFATDTGAYAVGRTIGSHKLAPSISPGKTWEGAIGGLAAAIVTGAVSTLVFGFGSQWMVVAAIMGITGQVGDLYVSKLKRRAGFDDSGAIFPGHGGMLDRLDSLSFNLIVIGLAAVALL
ncbi:MAG: phosphatidate cytidylyltransferase [Dehalococcoidia bacterium]|nr:phosphatidate cytidylyltransferase [Dehalococcoidia bacterium]